MSDALCTAAVLATEACADLDYTGQNAEIAAAATEASLRLWPNEAGLPCGGSTRDWKRLHRQRLKAHAQAVHAEIAQKFALTASWLLLEIIGGIISWLVEKALNDVFRPRLEAAIAACRAPA